ncbi:hypothetical protein [uncultured Aquimarina sp.]|uniref:hypothetical protein n=1 Tax=uncultured Aquimarina sp. TaxID=575652 RepID=UPI0026137664|nr:hypothetical protein [uncultured Aquimarina sp.]
MRKSLFFLCILISNINVFGQVNLNSSTGRVIDIDTDFSFSLTDKKYDRVLLQSGWLSGIGDYLSIKHGGGNTEAGTYGFRIGDHSGFDFGKNDFSSSFLKIMTNGKVGIGTTTPNEKLHIQDGNLSITNSQGNSSEYFGEIKFYNRWASNNITAASIGVKTKNGSNPFNYSNIVFNTWNGYNSLSEKMRINHNGNVGIGTTNPTEKLHIQEGNINIYGFNTSRYIRFTETNLQGGFINYDGTSNVLNIGVNNINNSDSNNDYNSISITRSNGNVGIGTTTPDAKLAVNGNIHTKEVKVDLIGWADYVFTEDYNLPTLQQVEDHIAKKGHLINIPSATEVAENGIQLGEMNAKLLEKIEELTLYTIAQEKKLIEQRREIEEFRNELNKLKIK